MSEVLSLVTDQDRRVADAAAVLNGALTSKFEAVLVIGIKNGRVWAQKSETIDTLQMLGACELAKTHLLQNWK